MARRKKFPYRIARSSLAGLMLFGYFASKAWDWKTVGIGIVVVVVTVVIIYSVASPIGSDTGT